MSQQQSTESTQAAKVHEQVSSQFGAAAGAYTQSLVHSNPDALRKIVELAQPKTEDIVLDIATGAGHTALALAPHVTQVIAYDMSPEMLLETKQNAKLRRLANVFTRKGVAEELPFPDSMFDIVTVRQAPHHFADVQAAVREMARVTKPQGRLVIVDSISLEDDSLELQWNHIEKLRDSSHVRNYRPTEWRAMLKGAGLLIAFEEIDFCTEDGHGMDFAAWTQRMRTPAEKVKELEEIFHSASPALRQALRIETAGDAILFCVPQISILAVRQ